MVIILIYCLARKKNSYEPSLEDLDRIGVAAALENIKGTNTVELNGSTNESKIYLTFTIRELDINHCF